MSLTLSPAGGTLVLLLGYLFQASYEDLCLVLLHPVMPCSVDIPGSWGELGEVEGGGGDCKREE